MIHLYNKTSTSQHIKELKDSLGFKETIDISKQETIPQYDLYFVEIDKIEKELLLNIKKLLLDKTQNLIYFFINDSHNLMLFQLASLLKVQSIFTPKHNCAKIITTIEKEMLEHEARKREYSIVQSITNDIKFMVFDKDDLYFASQKLYTEYNCFDLETVKSKVCSKIDTHTLLKEDTVVQNNLGVCRSATSKYDNKKYIYIEEGVQKSTLEHIDFIKNRIYFIEVLKDKFLQNDTLEIVCGLITIKIENMPSLRNDWDAYEIEIAVRDLLLQVDTPPDSHTILAQYDNDLYVTFFEGLDFEYLKKKASMIQTQIAAHTHEQKIKPIVGIYAIDINGLELNTILKVVSDVSREEMSRVHIEAKKLYRTIGINDDLDDAEIIDMMLQTTFTNKTPIKLLNLYKGLCINTSSVIVKKTNKEIYVTYENLQGAVMTFDKTTVMQSSNFSKDIVADVTYLDPKRKIAQFKNFRFSQGNANSRKYSRVTPSQRVPVTIIEKRHTVNGEIIDISMNSIAIKAKLHNKEKILKLQDVKLKFVLPNKNSSEGYMNILLIGKVIFTQFDEKFSKIVVDLEEDQSNESLLMQYVYDRQKEIITELKRQTSVLK